MAMYSHDTGTADTEVIATAVVKRYACLAGGSGGTVTITPKGGSALTAISVPANQPWSDDFTSDPSDLDANVELPAGSKIAFAGMGTWMVRYR